MNKSTKPNECPSYKTKRTKISLRKITGTLKQQRRGRSSMKETKVKPAYRAEKNIPV